MTKEKEQRKRPTIFPHEVLCVYQSLIYLILCATELHCGPKTIKTHQWATLLHITMNTHAVVYFDWITHTEHQMCINPLLKIVLNNCSTSSCLNATVKWSHTMHTLTHCRFWSFHGICCQYEIKNNYHLHLSIFESTLLKRCYGIIWHQSTRFNKPYRLENKGSNSIYLQKENYCSLRRISHIIILENN